MSRRVTRETLHGQVIYPEELPCSRGHMTNISSVTTIICIVAMCITDAKYKSGECISFFVVLIHYLTLSIFLEIWRRLLYFSEELKHLKSRHRNCMWHLTKKLLNFTSSAFVFILACIFATVFVILLGHEIEDHIVSVSLWQLGGVVAVAHLIQDLVKMSKNPIYDSVFLESLRRLDYGSGMAQNFFYGYLRLCLPNTGDQEKGIEERIDDFISKERLSPTSFPVKKLFVLIPSSTYIHNDLKDCSFGWMKSVGTLEKVVKDRAGCKGRPYKSTVYRIKDPDDISDEGVYVVAEGATPCKTLYEVVQYSGSRQEFYKEHQKEIVYNFYETLRETLRENRDCRNLCEIIYYVDTDEFDHNNVNVAQLILQRIAEIQEKEEFLRRVRDRNI